MIEIHLYGGLRRYVPVAPIGQAISIDLAQGATVRDALAALGIPAGEAKACFVAYVRRDLDRQLADGDELAVFPPVAGG